MEKIITIANETEPATELITTRNCQPLGLVRSECFVIPKPANVNPVNTPSA